MNLSIDDLVEYSKMSATERKTERGLSIRAEIEERMRWMPIRWRRLIRCRYIMKMGVIRTSLELDIGRNTVKRWTDELTEWLQDKDKYLDRQT